MNSHSLTERFGPDIALVSRLTGREARIECTGGTCHAIAVTLGAAGNSNKAALLVTDGEYLAATAGADADYWCVSIHDDIAFAAEPLVMRDGPDLEAAVLAAMATFQASGWPRVTCGWPFATSRHYATGVLEDPLWGYLPICDECRRVERIGVWTV